MDLSWWILGFGRGGDGLMVRKLTIVRTRGQSYDWPCTPGLRFSMIPVVIKGMLHGTELLLGLVEELLAAPCLISR